MCLFRQVSLFAVLIKAAGRDDTCFHGRVFRRFCTKSDAFVPFFKMAAESFEYLAELFPCFWGKLFLDGGKLYMLGVSREYGDLLIGRSEDGGRNWGMPTVLFRGSGFAKECGIHRAQCMWSIRTVL